MDDPKRLLASLIEIEGLDRIPRLGYSARGVDRPESVAEHSFHLALLVWALGRSEDLDLERALALALVHDVAEVRTGDLPRTVAGHLPAGAKQTLERGVFAELFGAEHDALSLFEEYSANVTVEARFVHECDRLQLLLKAHRYERWRAGEVADLFEKRHAERSEFESVAGLEAALAEARGEWLRKRSPAG